MKRLPLMRFYDHAMMFCIIVLLSSCIKEDYEQCPDYGKYRVVFNDADNSKGKTDYNVLVCPLEKGKVTFTNAWQYYRLADSSLLISERELKLFPMEYSFKALLSQNQMILAGSDVSLKTGAMYLYADSSASVIKAVRNNVSLRFTLANSLIRVICNFSENPISQYRISKVEISSADDNGIELNMLSGRCNSAQEVTDFYDECVREIDSNVFNYYCVPIVKAKYLNFKVFVEDISANKTNVLFSRVFLNTDIEQGKVYDYRFDVTPFDIEFKTTSILDWNDYVHSTNISLN